MTIYINFGGEWPLTFDRSRDPRLFSRGYNTYHRYARWLCFEFLWRVVK